MSWLVTVVGGLKARLLEVANMSPEVLSKLYADCLASALFADVQFAA